MIKIIHGEVRKRSDVFSAPQDDRDISGVVAEIIKDVRENGDAALIRYAKKFDKAELTSIRVTDEEIAAARKAVEPEFIRILNAAADNIRFYHERQKRAGFDIDRGNGVRLGERVMPIEKVGVYVPGGTAAYPSTVLMDCIPASVAGVGEVYMTTPPRADGSVDPYILAAAGIAGVSGIFKSGGAGAVAALAYGTETVPKVYKIVGPGNAYVAQAKRQVFGAVDIDMIAGPSEILVIADGASDASCVAADMLSQAEHDRMASAVLVTDSQELADKVANEIERQLELLPRKDIARASIEANGRIIVTDSIAAAVASADEIAPEHLELCADNAEELLKLVRNAGSVFVGRYTPEALGDYFAGTNHTLPTGGTAKFSSPLGVDDFVKKSQYIMYSKESLNAVADDIAYFADKEGLHGHAASAVSRKERD